MIGLNKFLLTVIPIISIPLLYYYNKENEKNKNTKSTKVKFSDNKSRLVYFSNETYFYHIINHIYKNYPDKINDITYNEDRVYTYNDWRYRSRKNSEHIKVKKVTPDLFNFTINHKYKGNYIPLSFKLVYLKENENEILRFKQAKDCSTEDIILKKLIISCENKDLLIDLMDEYKKNITDELNKYKKESKETIRIYYYQKDYWNLLSKSPKRSIDTLYLKKGDKQLLLDKVTEFYSDNMRDIYLSYGIPYKCVNMIYGPPGTGKTSLIKSIASEFNADVFILPITKDMLDTDLVGAFSYINDQESEKRIIVIEDIDTLFDERKEGDNQNGITLQGFLNCLDGFTCIEGTMLFITANKPEVLDYAFIRSCRIDYKLKLDYADKYQIKSMYEKFIPEQVDKFEDFYSLIRHKEITTAALQEFLFYNRKCENIIELVDQFYDILDKNDPKNFEILKEENKNFYS